MKSCASVYVCKVAETKKWEASSGIRRFAPCAPQCLAVQPLLTSLFARYTLATGLFRDINACIRNDNEDGLRRLASLLDILLYQDLMPNFPGN